MTQTENFTVQCYWLRNSSE